MATRRKHNCCCVWSGAHSHCCPLCIHTSADVPCRYVCVLLRVLSPAASVFHRSSTLAVWKLSALTPQRMMSGALRHVLCLAGYRSDCVFTQSRAQAGCSKGMCKAQCACDATAHEPFSLSPHHTTPLEHARFKATSPDAFPLHCCTHAHTHTQHTAPGLWKTTGSRLCLVPGALAGRCGWMAWK